MKRSAPKCVRCQKNAAVIFTQASAHSKDGPGYCPLCAKELQLPQLDKIFAPLGITDDNIEEVTEQMNQLSEGLYQQLDNIDVDALNRINEQLKGILENIEEGRQSQFFEDLMHANFPMNNEDGEDLDEDLEEEFEEDFEEDIPEESPEAPQDPITEEKTPATSKENPTSDEKQPPKKRRFAKGNVHWLNELFENLGEMPGMISIVQSHEPFIPQDEEEEEQVNEPKNAQSKEKKNRKFKYLSQYGTSLTQLAAQGKIDRVVGREKELLRVIQILNRRSKNNPVLLGEPGVGKTAIAEGLALKIHQGEVPEKLRGMEIYLLDMTGMVAGTQFRGQFESRLKGVIDEATKAGNIILVIDELHNIVGAGSAEGTMNAANILKPALAKGTLHVLGSTTLSEYRRFIEKDSALERRFQQVMVEEPTVAETIDILKNIRSYYETYHHVTYSDQVIVETVQMADRYIPERFFPDKAIDLIDEAGSKSNLNQQDLVDKKKIEQWIAEDEAKLKKLEEDYLKSLEKNEENLKLLEEKADVQSLLAKHQSLLDDLLERLHPHEITLDHIASIVELWTGIPVLSLTENEKEKLLHLEERLKQQVVGQDKAISSLARAIRRKRSGFSTKKKPNSFLFVGPTGVGKTELVKALARLLFGDEKALIRFDMSEFMEAHTVSKLIGSPPGYVGFEEAGQLTEKVRRRPYSVILLDEIEKAHKDVYNMLLQILDDGRLTDSKGRTVHFENTIIVMTSNAGTSFKNTQYGFNKIEEASIEQHVEQALKELFRPELLNRIDDTIIFNTLHQKEQGEILELMLAELHQEVKNHGLELSVTEEAKAYLLKKGYSKQFGARPLRRTLAREVEDLLAEAYLSNAMEGKTEVVVRYVQDQDTLQLEFKA